MSNDFDFTSFLVVECGTEDLDGLVGALQVVVAVDALGVAPRLEQELVAVRVRASRFPRLLLERDDCRRAHPRPETRLPRKLGKDCVCDLLVLLPLRVLLLEQFSLICCHPCRVGRRWCWPRCRHL